jgi:hypothetical protein
VVDHQSLKSPQLGSIPIRINGIRPCRDRRPSPGTTTGGYDPALDTLLENRIPPQRGPVTSQRRRRTPQLPDQTPREELHDPLATDQPHPHHTPTRPHPTPRHHHTNQRTAPTSPQRHPHQPPPLRPHVGTPSITSDFAVLRGLYFPP